MLDRETLRVATREFLIAQILGALTVGHLSTYRARVDEHGDLLVTTRGTQLRYRVVVALLPDATDARVDE